MYHLLEFLKSAPKVKAYGDQRRCLHCDKKLSDYNPNDYCWAYYDPARWFNQWTDIADRMRGLFRISQVEREEGNNVAEYAETQRHIQKVKDFLRISDLKKERRCNGETA